MRNDWQARRGEVDAPHPACLLSPLTIHTNSRLPCQCVTHLGCHQVPKGKKWATDLTAANSSRRTSSPCSAGPSVSPCMKPVDLVLGKTLVEQRIKTPHETVACPMSWSHELICISCLSFKPHTYTHVTTYSKRTYAHASLPSALRETQTHTETPTPTKPSPTCLVRCKDLREFACQREPCSISSFKDVIPTP